ncbi:MAG: VOC family protein [Dehalococcoidia bacterium]|nr:VOC family protein [Dehalococcoidia bacterium]
MSDLDRAAAFYRDVLGLELLTMVPEFNWAEFGTEVPGFTIGMGVNPENPSGGGSGINFGVTDLDAAKAALEQRGVSFTGEDLEVPGQVRIAEFSDPDGNGLFLVQRLA